MHGLRGIVRDAGGQGGAGWRGAGGRGTACAAAGAPRFASYRRAAGTERLAGEGMSRGMDKETNKTDDGDLDRRLERSVFRNLKESRIERWVAGAMIASMLLGVLFWLLRHPATFFFFGLGVILLVLTFVLQFVRNL